MTNKAFDPQASHVRVHLRNMEVEVRIGIHPHEREGERRQRIRVNIELFAALGDYLSSPNLESIIDYDHIYKAVKDWAERPHMLLIETYLKELAALCFADARIEACRIAVSKPDIFDDVEDAGVEVFLRREDYRA